MATKPWVLLRRCAQIGSELGRRPYGQRKWLFERRQARAVADAEQAHCPRQKQVFAERAICRLDPHRDLRTQLFGPLADPAWGSPWG